jgi:hypothetical protein
MNKVQDLSNSQHYINVYSELRFANVKLDQGGGHMARYEPLSRQHFRGVNFPLNQHSYTLFLSSLPLLSFAIVTLYVSRSLMLPFSES